MTARTVVATTGAGSSGTYVINDDDPEAIATGNTLSIRSVPAQGDSFTGSFTVRESSRPRCYDQGHAGV